MMEVLLMCLWRAYYIQETTGILKIKTMKTDKNVLDVDFIGGEGPLTKEEEIAISKFLIDEKTKRENHKLKQAAKNFKLKEPTI